MRPPLAAEALAAAAPAAWPRAQTAVDKAIVAKAIKIESLMPAAKRRASLKRIEKKVGTTA
jgi:secreted protein with Ig-like and vWFA domain